MPGLRWLPHYVSIRNRTAWGEDKNINLSKLIKQIQNYNQAIVEFYCANCRTIMDKKLTQKTLLDTGSQRLTLRRKRGSLVDGGLSQVCASPRRSAASGSLCCVSGWFAEYQLLAWIYM